MDKKTVLEEVCKSKIVAIFRGIDADSCSQAANALYDGGICFCEVTFRASEEKENYASTCNGIRNIINGAGDRRIYVGAGTVLTPKQVVLAYEAGAQFIITPNINTEVIRLANDLGMATMPDGGMIHIICNEEGRLQNLPHNCQINGVDYVGDIICAQSNADGDLIDLQISYDIWKDILRNE